MLGSSVVEELVVAVKDDGTGQTPENVFVNRFDMSTKSGLFVKPMPATLALEGLARVVVLLHVLPVDRSRLKRNLAKLAHLVARMNIFFVFSKLLNLCKRFRTRITKKGGFFAVCFMSRSSVTPTFCL